MAEVSRSGWLKNRGRKPQRFGPRQVLRAWDAHPGLFVGERGAWVGRRWKQLVCKRMK